MTHGLRRAPFRAARSGFSLLELLVAMFVIAFLAGVLFAAVTKLRESARRRDAQTQVTSIVNALKAYRAEYGRWPAQAQGATDETHVDNAPILAALLDNPRALEFLQTRASDLIGENLVDPWGHPYVIALDANGDDCVDIHAALDAAILDTTVMRDSVAVFSWGRNVAEPEGRICSW